MTPTEETTYREGIQKDLAQIKNDQREMMKMVKYTNGKVRKTIIALVLIGGIFIGQVMTSQQIIQSVVSLIKI